MDNVTWSDAKVSEWVDGFHSMICFGELKSRWELQPGEVMPFSDPFRLAGIITQNALDEDKWRLVVPIPTTPEIWDMASAILTLEADKIIETWDRVKNGI